MKSEISIGSIDQTSLVVDGSGVSVFAGLLGSDGKWLAQVQQNDAPLEGLFPAVEAVLHEAHYRILDLCSFIYCEGPGSVLGLRLCAMGIQTWGHFNGSSARYFAYNSLELMAALIVLDFARIEHALLISDWKKNVWNSISITDGQLGPVTGMDDQTVNNWKKGPLFYLPQRKSWQSVPDSVTTLKYSPYRLPEALQLLKKTRKIELYKSNTNVFQKWIPNRHRASN